MRTEPSLELNATSFKLGISLFHPPNVLSSQAELKRDVGRYCGKLEILGRRASIIESGILAFC